MLIILKLKSVKFNDRKHSGWADTWWLTWIRAETWLPRSWVQSES